MRAFFVQKNRRRRQSALFPHIAPGFKPRRASGKDGGLSDLVPRWKGKGCRIATIPSNASVDHEIGDDRLPDVLDGVDALAKCLWRIVIHDGHRRTEEDGAIIKTFGHIMHGYFRVVD